MGRGLLLLVVGLSVLAGCGGYGDGQNAQLEDDVASAMRAQIADAAAMVEVRSVDCSGRRPQFDCQVALGVGNVVVQVDYTVAIDATNCWTAGAEKIVVLGAGSGTIPLREIPAATNLKGCLQ